MISLNNCPICDNKFFSHFISCTDHTTSQELFSLKKCTACGFTFTDPRPSEKSISKYYLSNKYISHSSEGGNFINFLYRTIRKFALIKKRKIINRFTPGSKILDFGCGTGEFLSEMKSNGWKIAGVEPSSLANNKAADTTKEKIHFKIEEITDNQFDVVTLWHVFEHLENPAEYLANFKTVLKPSGIIFIAVPNLESYDAQYYKSHWAAYDVPRHLWHFNKQSMSSLLKKNGFELIEIIPMKMDSFYISYLSETYLHPNRSKITSMISGLIRGLYSNIKATRKNNYSSLIYVAKI